MSFDRGLSAWFESTYQCNLTLYSDASMANLYKPRYTKEDPKTGERVTRRVRKWYGKYRDPSGALRKVPLCEDKQAAQAMLTDIVRSVEREKAGIIDAVSRCLADKVSGHVKKYRTHLESKGRSESHISETVRLISNIVTECRVSILSELQTADDQIEQHLTERRRAGSSHRTVNADLAAIRSFCRWLLKRQRMHRDPTIALQKLNESEDRRLERRALTDEEAEKLMSSTLDSKKIFRKLKGHDRAFLYLLAQRTGLRRSELRSLTPGSFDFSSEPATVSVQAANSKRRKFDRLPLSLAVSLVIEEYVRDKSKDQPVWPGSWWQHSAEMIRRDLTEAKIPIQDEEGRVMDFHGQRTTFITALSRAGLSPALAQKLARHSDIKLTMGTYTQLDMTELGQAVERLPSLTPSHVEEQPSDSPRTRKQQLQELTALWDNLSDDVRRAILKLVV